MSVFNVLISSERTDTALFNSTMDSLRSCRSSFNSFIVSNHLCVFFMPFGMLLSYDPQFVVDIVQDFFVLLMIGNRRSRSVIPAARSSVFLADRKDVGSRRIPFVLGVISPSVRPSRCSRTFLAPDYWSESDRSGG